MHDPNIQNTTKEDYYLRVYSEACITLRHYSNSSLTVRAASIVQGIALLIAWVSVEFNHKSGYTIAIPIAGFLFTWLLYRFHKGYFEATEIFYESAANIEKKLFDEDCRPHAKYLSIHKEKYSDKSKIFFTINAPFTLVGSLFFCAFLISMIKYKYIFNYLPNIVEFIGYGTTHCADLKAKVLQVFESIKIFFVNLLLLAA